MSPEQQSISQSVILAAGRGTRMGSATEEIPKPMLSIHGRPMIDLIVERLSLSGISRFLVVIGHQGETIRHHFEGTKPVLEFVSQKPVDGTGSAALLARNFAADKPFLLAYGDILCDPEEYRQAAATFFTVPEISAVLAVKEVDDPWQGAAVYEEYGRISRILEKPLKGTSTTRWNSAGFYIFRPVIFDYLRRLQPSPRGEYELTSAIESMVADGLDLRISPIRGSWRDVGRPEDLAAMNR